MAGELFVAYPPETRDLRAALIAAPDLDAAVAVTLDHLQSPQLPMLTLYLARGDRLRCLGQRGWAHVHDGLQLTAGVVGSTYVRGVSTRTVPEDAPEFIAAAGGIAEEVCVPIRVADKVVGILNVESMERLPDDAVSIVEECARLFRGSAGRTRRPTRRVNRRPAGSARSTDDRHHSDGRTVGLRRRRRPWHRLDVGCRGDRPRSSFRAGITPVQGVLGFHWPLAGRGLRRSARQPAARGS